MIAIVMLLVLALLLAVTGLQFFRVLGAAANDPRVNQTDLNIQMAQEQLGQLREARAAGDIDEAVAAASEQEIEENLALALQGEPVASAKSDRASSRPAGTSRIGPAVLLISAIGGALATYWYVGEPQAFDASYVASMSPEARAEQNQQAPSIDELLPRLQAHLETNPADVQGWQLLTTTLLRLQRFDEAAVAGEKALKLAPDDINVLMLAADAKAMSANGELRGEPLALIDKALAVNPNDIRANWMRGLAANQIGDAATAIRYWEPLLPRLREDPGARQQLQSMLADARSRLAGGAAASVDQSDSETSTESNTATASVVTASLQVSVELAAALSAEAKPDDVLFVYAKASAGPPMPLAVARLQVSDLPATVTLDDSMAMMPQMRLSGFDNVTVGARVSFSGDPVGQVGDLFAEINDIAVAAETEVNIVIDQVLR